MRKKTAYYDAFTGWLVNEKGLTTPSAYDVLSRCRRVEKVLGVSLEEELKAEDGLERVLERITKEAPSHLRPGSNNGALLSQLRRATRLLAEYRAVA